MPNNASNIKEEPDEDIEDEEDDNEPTPFAAALGLHRVGSAPPKKPQQQPIQTLNARGMPARIRKKNKLFFDDDIVNEKPLRTSPIKRPVRTEPVKSPSKSAKKRRMTPSKLSKPKEDANDSDDEPEKISSTAQTFDRIGSQRIGLRLRNILKLPKAHKWVGYEFFYSYLDRSLFEGENDFQICLHDLFPALSNRQLTRIEWNKVRKLMGKPRRSSQAFFDEERHELERRRQKIRLLQTRKSADLEFVRDLPNEIPLPLPVGTKVTARLRHPQDGMFTGSIDAFDSMSSIYRITFDRVGLGTHSVPDFEVAANEFIESIPLNTITKDSRPKNNSQYLNRKFGLLSGNKNDPLLGSEIYNNSKLKSIMLSKESIGGFQLKHIEMIIRTKKTIAAKQMKLVRLKSMNAEAEILKSTGDTVSEDFQRRYASILIGMEKLNCDLTKYLSQIQTLSRDLTKEPLIAAMLTPSYLREQCKSLALDTVEKNNQAVKEESMLRLITDLATIMWVASNLSSDEGNSSARTVLDVCLEESKSRLDPENIGEHTMTENRVNFIDVLILVLFQYRSRKTFKFI